MGRKFGRAIIANFLKEHGAKKEKILLQYFLIYNSIYIHILFSWYKLWYIFL